MEIGDEIIIKAEVVDFDANPHGAAIKIKVQGFIDDKAENQPYGKEVRLWIHRLQQPDVIVEK